MQQNIARNKWKRVGFKKMVSSCLLLLLPVSLINSPTPTSAYTDYSIHRLVTGGIVGEANVKDGLERLKGETGWWATYESTGTKIPYYQVFSGGFAGEENVIGILDQFQSSTNINSRYEPVGVPVPYEKVYSGGFYGEKTTSDIAQAFQDSTGIKATIEPTGQGVPKKKIVTGGFLGEENIKSILQQFQASTGISATYEPTGQYQDYYSVVSGGFYGEDTIKTITQDFITQTGINAKYEPSGYVDVYTVLTGGFLGEATVQALVNQIYTEIGINAKYIPTTESEIFKIQIDSLYGEDLTKVINYMKKTGWWNVKLPTGEKKPMIFRVVSDSSLDKAKLDIGLEFFTNRGWWAYIGATGQKNYNVFRIVSNPMDDDSQINKGLKYFQDKGWWVTYNTTNEMSYSIYRVVSEPLLGREEVDKALGFFKSRGWWSSSQYTDQTGYTVFRIVTEPILGPEKNEQALRFFQSRGWWVGSQLTGKSEEVYRIITGGFQGYETALANARMMTDRYGWFVSTEKIQNGSMVTYTQYNFTLNEMLNLEMKYTPQTDKYKNDPAYIHSAYIDVATNKINASNVNVRSGPGTDFEAVAKVNTGFNQFKILGYEGEWVKISMTWKNAKQEDVLYYLNPNNFPEDTKYYFQFLKLSKPANININEVNEKILNNNTGILKGTASAFVQAAQLYNINEVYLISHALLETGNGSSTLAKGVLYNGKVVYNMFGYGAYDSCPIDCGAQKAYEQGWFTPELAIVGGAKLIGDGYIYNDKFQQDTLYKMRWNPIVPYHQYATDIGWAAKQVNNIYNIYQLLDKYTLYVDLPVYKQ